MTTPTRPIKNCILYEQSHISKIELQKYTNDEALAFLVDLKLIKYQYKNLRTLNKNKKANIYRT